MTKLSFEDVRSIGDRLGYKIITSNGLIHVLDADSECRFLSTEDIDEVVEYLDEYERYIRRTKAMN